MRTPPPVRRSRGSASLQRPGMKRVHAQTAAVLERWPVVIAHEYARLRNELARGAVVPAIVQLKDVAEVLIKLPMVVAGRLLIDHGSLRQRGWARVAAGKPATVARHLARRGWQAGHRGAEARRRAGVVGRGGSIARRSRPATRSHHGHPTTSEPMAATRGTCRLTFW